MPVLDIAGAQKLAQPVTSFYQGKAMRLALENDALRGEALRKEIGAFDAREARDQYSAETSRMQVENQMAQEERLREQFQADMAKRLPEMLADPITRNVFQSTYDRLKSAKTPEEKKAISDEAERDLFKLHPDLVKYADISGDEEFDEEEIGRLLEYTAPAASGQPSYRSSQSGINPATGEEEMFTFDSKTGNVKWLGVAGAPSGENQTEKENIQAQLEDFSARYESEDNPLTPEEIVKYKLTWVRAKASGMDPGTAGLKNPGVTAEEKQFTALQKKEIVSAIRQLDMSAEWIDSALQNVGPWTVGAPGAAVRFVETIQGFMSDKASQPAKDFQRAMTKLKATNWQELLGSGQISLNDYLFLSKIFEGEGFGDDPVATANSLVDLRDWFAFKRDEHAVSIGRAPSAAIQYLREHPETKAQFREIYPDDPNGR